MKLRLVVLIMAFCVVAGYSGAQTSSSGSSGAPYTEGPVWDITMVKTKPGMGDKVAKVRNPGNSRFNSSTTRLIRKLPKLMPRNPSCVLEID